MGCAASTIKYLLFIFNFFLTLCGILIIVVGILTNSKASTFKELLSGNVSFASMLLIGTGVVIFVVAFFGCCGAIQESHCMMTTYAILLLTIFFVEIGIGVLAFVYRAKAQEYLSYTVDHIFDKYDDGTPENKNAVDAVQRELHCCGTSGPSSWGGSYPASCCVDRDDRHTKISSCPGDMWTVGCVERLTELAKDLLTRLGWIAIAVGSVELVGIVFALCLASSIRRSELRGYA